MSIEPIRKLPKIGREFATCFPNWMRTIGLYAKCQFLIDSMFVTWSKSSPYLNIRITTRKMYQCRPCSPCNDLVAMEVVLGSGNWWINRKYRVPKPHLPAEGSILFIIRNVNATEHRIEICELNWAKSENKNKRRTMYCHKTCMNNFWANQTTEMSVLHIQRCYMIHDVLRWFQIVSCS